MIGRLTKENGLNFLWIDACFGLLYGYTPRSRVPTQLFCKALHITYTSDHNFLVISAGQNSNVAVVSLK
jgi:hypothetical protein